MPKEVVLERNTEKIRDLQGDGQLIQKSTAGTGISMTMMKGKKYKNLEIQPLCGL